MSDVSPTVMPYPVLSHRAHKVMLKTNVLQHLSANVVVCRYEKIDIIRQVACYSNAF